DSSRSNREACLSALFVTDPRNDRERLINVKGSRVDGTCKWIEADRRYNTWLHPRSDRSQLLWLSGGPGKGKTILSIFLAEELERNVTKSQDEIFVQYFCDSKIKSRNTAVAIVRGLIWQFLKLRPKLFDHILPDFTDRKETQFITSFESLWKIFENMVHDPVLRTIYCILDGLDECDESSLEVLLKKFKDLFSTKSNESSCCNLRLIAVSRDFPDIIPQELSSFPQISLDSDAESEINSDIRQFIKVKVDELSAYGRYPESLRIHVKDVFLKRSKGTFLWVGIVAKELRKYKPTDVENALRLFPSGLEELYAGMLHQIDVNRRKTAAHILRWVVMAVRPLTLSELGIAIGARASIGFCCDDVTRDQVSYCGNFLTIKDNEVGLVHQSAKDYFLRKTGGLDHELECFRIKEETANLEIARKCLEYLQNDALAGGEESLDTSRLKTFPLLAYAALHWPEHAR
ncbi:hypothetical protein B0O99DRAFT_719265, partial [Bisporella sp. PMI_857]